MLAEFACAAFQTNCTRCAAQLRIRPTPREHEVLNLSAAGATDKEIAAQLSLCLHTVKSHVRSILSKLHAINRRHAADLAGRQGRAKTPKS